MTGNKVAIYGGIVCRYYKTTEGSSYDFFGPSSFFPMSAPGGVSNSSCQTRQVTRHTTKFDTKGPLHLGEDLGAGDSLSSLVVLDDRGLLVDLLGEILLCQLLVRTSSLDGLSWRMSDLVKGWTMTTHLADRGKDLWRRCNLVFAIEFRYSLVIRAWGKCQR